MKLIKEPSGLLAVGVLIAAMGCGSNDSHPPDNSNAQLTGDQMIAKVKNDPKMDDARKRYEIDRMQSSPLVRGKQGVTGQQGN